MAQVPHGRSLVESYQDQPFTLLGVNTDAAADDLAQRTQDKKISWRSFADGSPSGPISTQWGVKAFPSTFLIDHEGVVRGVDLKGDELTAEIDRLLEEAKKS